MIYRQSTVVPAIILWLTILQYVQILLPMEEIVHFLFNLSLVITLEGVKAIPFSLLWPVIAILNTECPDLNFLLQSVLPYYSQQSSTSDNYGILKTLTVNFREVCYVSLFCTILTTYSFLM